MNRFVRIVLESLALVGLVGGIVIVTLNYNHLPETIPIHFGLSGKPDGFGSKVWLLVVSVLSAVMYLTMTIARRYPQCSNTPWKITEENKQRQYALIEWLLTWLKAENALLFAFLQWTMVQVALGLAVSLNPVVMLIWVTMLLGTIGVYFYLGYKAR